MRKRLSPGVILGVIAVVIACSGSATAGVLITSGKIKDGTIQGRDIKKGTIGSDRLASTVRAQLRKAGTHGAQGTQGTQGPAGAKGDKGDTGETGATGPTVQGSAPAKGEKGDTGATGATGATGPAGKDGANPATLVDASGDDGWQFAGGGTGSTYPTASFNGGKLRLQGGFDGRTPSGAIGLVHEYASVPLNTLATLSYDFRIVKRPDAFSAPAIHVTLLKAATGTESGFTNLVFEPYQQPGATFGLNQSYSVDALAGKWWATRAAGGIDQSHLASWSDVINKNPDAVIVGISFDNGGSSSNTIPAADFAADVDNTVVGFGSEFTRFDLGR